MKFDKVYYCDTDSLIVDHDELQGLLDQGILVLDKRKYGYMDLEQTSEDLFIVSPKNYYMNENKMSLKSYRDGDAWTASYKDPDTGEATENVVMRGNKRCKDMYECFLNEDIIVTTTFTKITKRLGVKSPDSDEYELAYLHTAETVKILE